MTSAVSGSSSSESVELKNDLITLNIGGRSFTYLRQTLIASGENHLSALARRADVAASDLFQDVTPSYYEQFIDPFIRGRIVPGLDSYKTSHEASVVLDIATRLSIQPIIDEFNPAKNLDKAFGAEQWLEYFGWEVKDVPQCPENLEFDPETEVMFLVPAGLSADRFTELAQNPLKGEKIGYIVQKSPRSSLELDSWEVPSSYWAVISRTLLESECLTVSELKCLVVNKGFNVPTLLEVLVAMIGMYLTTGVKLLPYKYYTVCLMGEPYCAGEEERYSAVGKFPCSSIEVLVPYDGHKQWKNVSIVALKRYV
jgi:hypothetical protein